VRADLAPAVEEVTSPADARPLTENQRAGRRPTPVATSPWSTTVLGASASTIVVLGAEFGGRAFRSDLPGAWFFGVPGTPLGSLAPGGSHTPLLGILGVYGGLLLLSTAWLKLLLATRRPCAPPLPRVVGIVALWALPLALAPPLFSRDLYSYAAQGEMVSHHIDPYRYGTAVIGATPFTTLAGPLWSTTPSPYGPTFLGLDALATDISGHQVLADLVLLRLLALAGLALAAVGTASIARGLGRDPTPAVVLGVGSPLALTTLVGGAHNDALMAGLLTIGVALAIRRHPVAGVVVCALATGVKAPAALGVVFVAWNWDGPCGSWTRRVGRLALAGLLSSATLAAVSAISGVGWGWLSTLGAASKISTGVTPLTALSHAVVAAGHGVGLVLAPHTVRSLLDSLGFVTAAGLVLMLLWDSPRSGWVRGLGLGLFVVAVLSPVLWPWYLCWGLLVLAPLAGTRLGQLMVGVSIVEALVGPASVGPMARSVLHLPPSGIVALFTVIAVTVAVVALRWRGTPFVVTITGNRLRMLE
jgi:hypothetical protein